MAGGNVGEGGVPVEWDWWTAEFADTVATMLGTTRSTALILLLTAQDQDR